MATNGILSTLTDSERKDLALCGVTTDEQLANTSVTILWNDLLRAKEFFENYQLSITEEKLNRLYEAERLSGKPRDILQQEPLTAEGYRVKHQDFTQQMNLHREPATEPRSKTKRGVGITHTLEKKHGSHSKFHAIHCSHPLRVYLGALSVILLIPALLLLLGVPVILFLNLYPEISPLLYAAALVALVLPYLLFGMRCECNVCHISLYRLHSYPHHRLAHRYPLLGYNLSNALHILLLFRFNCPACGTTLKLFGSHKNQTPHHH